MFTSVNNMVIWVSGLIVDEVCPLMHVTCI